MARGAWDKTAMICAVFVNSNPFKDSKARRSYLWDFNPYRQKPQHDKIPVEVKELKHLWQRISNK